MPFRSREGNTDGTECGKGIVGLTQKKGGRNHQSTRRPSRGKARQTNLSVRLERQAVERVAGDVFELRDAGGVAEDVTEAGEVLLGEVRGGDSEEHV